jgi:hypothetical protein
MSRRFPGAVCVSEEGRGGLNRLGRPGAVVASVGAGMVSAEAPVVGMVWGAWAESSGVVVT